MHWMKLISPDEILGSALDFLMFILYWQVKFAWICAFSDIRVHGWLEVLGFRDWPWSNQTDGQLLIVYNGANVAEISSNYHKVMVSFDLCEYVECSTSICITV